MAAWIVGIGGLPGAERIAPWPENPRYWAIGGEPVLLLGGTDDDNPFQWPDAELRAHLDRLAEAGGNYVRCTMSDRRDKGFEEYPFHRNDDGKYDLTRWNAEYWRRFERFLDWTGERRIIVQIEVWDRFDHSRENWETHPYNPANNVNYTGEESGLAAEYPDHPGANRQPFFFTTPKQRNNAVLLPIQQAFVSRMLETALPHGHVLYCIDNETSGEEEWGVYWAEFIHSAAKARGVEVNVTEMWDDWDLKAERHRRTFDHPERYQFADVSQNNHMRGDTHWENFQWVRSRIAGQPRPLNTVKTYGADGGRFGTTRDGIERWWRHLVGGAAAMRFHRPDSGIGLSDAAVESIRAARKVESMLPLWNLQPLDLDSLQDREENEAFAAADAGKGYVVFFTDGGEIGLDASAATGELQVTWIDVRTGEARPDATRKGGGVLKLSAPGDGPWVAVVTAESGG